MHINPCYNADFQVQLGDTESWKECCSCKDQQSRMWGKVIRTHLNSNNSCNREKVQWTELNCNFYRGDGHFKENEGAGNWVTRGSTESGKWKVTESGKGCLDLWHPPGFATWHFWTLVSSSHAEAGGQRPHLRCWLEQTLNSLPALSFLRQVL